MAQEKVSDKQYELLLQLYTEQGKKVTPEVMLWLSNMPATEVPMYIEKWIEKNRKRKATRKSWRSTKGN